MKLKLSTFPLLGLSMSPWFVWVLVPREVTLTGAMWCGLVTVAGDTGTLLHGLHSGHQWPKDPDCVANCISLG